MKVLLIIIIKYNVDAFSFERCNFNPKNMYLNINVLRITYLEEGRLF